MDRVEVNQENEFWPLSGEQPYFSVTLSISHLKPSYRMTVPVKVQHELPKCPCPYRGKKWKMSYLEKRFDPRWREFVIENDLKAGDACVFEIIKNSKKLVEFKVQILRGDIPSEVLEKEDGYTANAPIRIE